MSYRFKQNTYELSRREYVQEDWYYRVYTDKGSYSFIRRSDAFDYYSSNNGYRIETITKELKPTIKVIVNERGLDTGRIREDLTIKKCSSSQLKAMAKYDKANTKQICIKLNLNTDGDIIAYLESLDNKNGFIKDLIREKIGYRYIPIQADSKKYGAIA